eukprot:scaffold585229_cov45-Prasinocladus_malaysianus.AAC.1
MSTAGSSRSCRRDKSAQFVEQAEDDVEAAASMPTMGDNIGDVKVGSSSGTGTGTGFNSMSGGINSGQALAAGFKRQGSQPSAPLPATSAAGETPSNQASNMDLSEPRLKATRLDSPSRGQ